MKVSLKFKAITIKQMLLSAKFKKNVIFNKQREKFSLALFNFIFEFCNCIADFIALIKYPRNSAATCGRLSFNNTAEFQMECKGSISHTYYKKNIHSK